METARTATLQAGQRPLSLHGVGSRRQEKQPTLTLCPCPRHPHRSQARQPGPRFSPASGSRQRVLRERHHVASPWGEGREEAGISRCRLLSAFPSLWLTRAKVYVPPCSAVHPLVGVSANLRKPTSKPGRRWLEGKCQLPFRPSEGSQGTRAGSGFVTEGTPSLNDRLGTLLEGPAAPPGSHCNRGPAGASAGRGARAWPGDRCGDADDPYEGCALAGA